MRSETLVGWSLGLTLVALLLASGCTEDLLSGGGGRKTPNGSEGKNRPPDGADGADGGVVGGAAGGDEGAICRSGSELDIFDRTGKLDPAAYRAVAAAFGSAAAVGYRFGQRAGQYHPTPESFPTAYAPGDHEFPHGDGQPKSTWQIGGPFEQDPGGYNTSAGQVVYVADDPNRPGVDAVQFIEVANAVISEKPQLSWTAYGGGAPDQSTKDDAMLAAHGGPFREPVAIARAVTTDQWTQDAILAFADGSLLTSGTHASGGNSNVFLKLPAGLVPTAIALTTNNEAALVTVWDTANVRGGIAVVALGGPAEPGFWGDWNQVYPGLHSYGLFSTMKLLGVVWLAGMVAPVSIAASADIRWPMIGAPEPKSLDLSNESARRRFVRGGDLAVRYAAAGFAVVGSRSEKKIAFVDLQPLFAAFAAGYFGDRAAFDRTRQMGSAPDQWPYTFEVAPAAKPVVVDVRTIESCPTALATTIHVFAPHNFVDPNDDRHARVAPTFGAHALVGTEDGTIHVLDVGGLADDRPASVTAIAEASKIVVGRNPTSIVPLGRTGAAFGSPVDYAVVSRGDRRAYLLRGDPKASTLTLWKTLADSRLVDPVSVEDVTEFGNHVPLIEIADFEGKQVVAYRYDKAVLHFYQGKEVGLGPSGSDPFECGGVYKTAGGALFVSSTNVP